MPSMYKRGVTFEYRIRDKLRAQGYFVIRSAGSKTIDLVAIKDGRVVLIECKKNKRLVTSHTRDFLKYIGETYKVKTVVAYKHKGRIIFEIIHNPNT